MILKAPAKINIGLRINYRRPDGYHDIESVMQQIGLCDYLYFEEIFNNDIKIICRGPEIPLHSNLVYKAAAELKKQYGIPAGVKILLYKNIPVGAGLAGGSSDAAATLIALNKMWNLDMQFHELLRIGEKLGADVPFCIRGGTAMVRGKGEIITSLPRWPFMGLVLAKPSGLSLSTEEVYGKYARGTYKGGFTYDNMIDLMEEGNKKALLEWIKRQNNLNMLEKAVLPDNPPVKRLKEEFVKLGLCPLMSGSGPSVFALTLSLKTACEAAFRLEQEGYRSWASWTL